MATAAKPKTETTKKPDKPNAQGPAPELAPTSNKSLILRHMQLAAENAVDLPNDMALAISEAQLVVMTQKTNPRYIRTREGRGGKQLKYVDHAYVTERLNLAFGWAWDFTIMENGIFNGFDGKPYEAWCRAQLKVTTPSGVIVKEQFGCQPIELLKNGTNPVSLGDALKGAGSDALKKCASLLGIGLDLYDSDGDIAGDRHQAQGDRMQSKVAVVEEIPKERTTVPPVSTEMSAPPSSVPPEPEPQTVRRDTDGHELDENGEYAEGALRYKLNNNQTLVLMDFGNGQAKWVGAETPVVKLYNQAALKKLIDGVAKEYFGGNNFEMGNHLKKHFRKGTLPALTGEELAALVAWKSRQNPDLRWYAGQAAGDPPLEDSPSSATDPFGVTGDAALAGRMRAATARLKDPAPLAQAFAAAGWSWATQAEQMAGIAEMLADGTIELGDVKEMLGHA